MVEPVSMKFRFFTVELLGVKPGKKGFFDLFHF